MYTEQEAFNKNWQHFVVEGNKQARTSGVDMFSLKKNSICAYLNHANKSCGIGILLDINTLKKVRKEGQNHDVNSLCRKYTEVSKELEGLGENFLFDLQNCHDDYETECGVTFTEHMKTQLTELAQEYQLVIPGE